MQRKEGDVVAPGGSGLPPTTVRRDPTNPAVLGPDPKAPPFVDPRISNPAALRYAEAAQGRRRGMPLPKYTEPVAGGPDMPIPLLAGEAAKGTTMAEQALQQRGAATPVMPELAGVLKGMGMEPALHNGASIVEGTAHQQPAVAPRSGGLQPPPGILPTDLLPEQAMKDPNFQQGHGSMFAANQPDLALKYGVMRGKAFVPPQQLRPVQRTATAGALKPETVDGLRALKELEDTRHRAESGRTASDRQIEEEARQGPAGGAGETKAPLTQEEREKLLSEMDDYQVSRLKSALFKDMLNNEVQRELIEARLQPLDLGDLIVTGRVTQVVPVTPGRFEPEFQSYDGEDDLIVKRLIGDEAGLATSDRYILDKYQLMGLTIALRALNKKQLPDYRDHDGKFDDNLFWNKYAIVSRFNYHMLASLMVNWFWFDMRVRRLFRAEELGNG